MDQTSLTFKIDRAWALRINQRVEEVAQILIELKQELGLPSHWDGIALDGSADKKWEQSVHAARVFLLQASVSRFRGDLDGAAHWIAGAEQVLGEERCRSSLDFNFQKGLMCFAEGCFTEALEFFLTASSLAGNNPFICLTSTVNALLCMENLNISRGIQEKNVKHLFGKIDRKKVDVSEIQVIWDSYLMRQTFRNGAFLDLPKWNTQYKMNQASYYRLWLNELPYSIRYREVPEAQVEKFIHSQETLYQKKFRIRTLQGLLHPQDAALVHHSDFADRFYLWVWRWMTSPRQFPAERVGALIGMLNTVLIQRLSSEDRLMLRNALGWLKLFDPTSNLDFSRILLALEGAGSDEYSLLDLEYGLIQVLAARRDQRLVEMKDYLVHVKSHRLFQSKDCHWGAILHSVLSVDFDSAKIPTHLNDFVVALRQITTPLNEVCGQKNVRVFWQSGRIETLDPKEVIFSEAMASAFYLLKREIAVEQSRFAHVCFGVRHYEAQIHQPKIFNLLNRIKKITRPVLDFKVKEGKVWASGEWNDVCFVDVCFQSAQLMELPGLKALRMKGHAGIAVDRRGVGATSVYSIPEWVTRKQLEKVTGKSRASVNRLLEELKKSGALSVKGLGRKTQYRMSLNAKKRIANEGVK